MFIYAFGMLLFVISIPLSANIDAYSWTRVQNISYFAFGRLGLVSSFACMILIVITNNGYITNLFLSWSIWRPLSRLTLAAYLVHPLGPALQYYMTDSHIFVDIKSVLYFILCTYVTCYLLAF